VVRTYRAGVNESEAVFCQLVADPASDPPLDEGAALIAAVGGGADVGGTLARLDDLAAGALAFPDARTAAGLAHVLFVDWAFAGNTADYGDPRNSFLPDVIDRRLGLPITLAVLMIEVGRRIGVGLTGVGMPGHFLVGVVDDPTAFVDPFHAGAMLDRDGCRARFVAVHGSDATFRDEYLAPTSARLILLRMLANLQQTYVARRSAGARWVARLRLAFPELPVEERRRSADVLASVGAFDEAAAALDALLADAPDPAARDALGRQALGYRARSN
jgi:regulator of sirC expression with transglutaminase-like and TPR domain